jgi:hypothetical protein
MAVTQVLAPLTTLRARWNVLVLPTVILLSVSGVLWAAARWRSFGVGVWGLVPLGLLAAVGLFELDSIVLLGRPGLAYLTMLALGFALFLGSLTWRVKLTRLDKRGLLAGACLALTAAVAALPALTYEGYRTLYATYFVLVGAGLLLARHSGLSAGLFVLSGAALFMNWHIEAMMYLRDAPSWGTLVKLAEPALFFVVGPVWVLRSRSVHGQVAGLLLPTAAYFVILVAALAAARGFSLSQSASIASPALVTLATVAVASVLYAKVPSALTGGGARCSGQRALIPVAEALTEGGTD